MRTLHFTYLWLPTLPPKAGSQAGHLGFGRHSRRKRASGWVLGTCSCGQLFFIVIGCFVCRPWLSCSSSLAGCCHSSFFLVVAILLSSWLLSFFSLLGCCYSSFFLVVDILLCLIILWVGRHSRRKRAVGLTADPACSSLPGWCCCGLADTPAESGQSA